MSGSGRFYVGRYWQRWAVYDASHLPGKRVGDPHDTQAEAQAAADRLNAPKPKPERQLTLDETGAA